MNNKVKVKEKQLMRSMVRKMLLFCLIAGLAFLSGCTQTPVNPSGQGITTHPATMPASEIPTVPASVSLTTIFPTTSPTTITTTIPPKLNAVPAAEADPADVSQIRFIRYADSDFSMDYPSAWNISKSTYTSSICGRTDTSWCYQNELRTIGPFYFGEMEGLKKPARIVTFTSADGRQKLVAFISDFFDNANQNFGIDPNILWVKNRVTDSYPDVAGSAVGDYQYDRSGNSMTISYSVTMPVGSKAYPLAYKTKNFFTVHHNYEFAFISDNENIQKYRNLEERILSSITPNDIS
jgi:hypothetical protein